MRLLMIGYCLCALASRGAAADYEQAAQAPKWQWHAERADFLSCVYRYLDRYQVEIVAPQRAKGQLAYRELTVRLSQDGQLLHTFSAYPEVVFVLFGDALYIAYPRRGGTGCSVVAYDIRARKQLWEARLQSVSNKPHSGYRNRVTIDCDWRSLVITGNETPLRYREVVDLKTGKTVAQHEFPLE